MVVSVNPITAPPARHKATKRVPVYVRKAEEKGRAQQLLDACEIGDYRSVETLLKEGGDPNVCDHKGFSAMSEAACAGYFFLK